MDGHCLKIPADTLLKTNAQGIPREVSSITQSENDFRNASRLRQKTHVALDANYCLRSDAPDRITLSNNAGTVLKLTTKQDGLQVYAAGKLNQTHAPFGMQSHAPFSGLCLEPQAFPNAVNRPDFPSVIVTPETPYRQVIKIELTDENAK